MSDDRDELEADEEGRREDGEEMDHHADFVRVLQKIETFSRCCTTGATEDSVEGEVLFRAVRSTDSAVFRIYTGIVTVSSLIEGQLSRWQGLISAGRRSMKHMQKMLCFTYFEPSQCESHEIPNRNEP